MAPTTTTKRPSAASARVVGHQRMSTSKRKHTVPSSDEEEEAEDYDEEEEEDEGTEDGDASQDESSDEEKEVEVDSVVGQEFDSWEDFFRFVAQYDRNTYQLHVRNGAQLASKRNEKLDRSSPYWVPEGFEHYQRTMTCTHGMPRRNRSAGKRPRRKKMCFTGCHAHLNACVQNGKVVITNHNNVHNHEVSARMYKRYPKVRNAIPTDVMDRVRRMHAHDDDRRTIWNYIRDNAVVDIDMKDVHNLMQKMERESYTAATKEGRVQKYLADFAAEPGSTSRVNTTEHGYLESIVLQSGHMRTIFKGAPQVVLLDATHGTIRENFKLLSFMVPDGFGNGQHVQHALVENERAITLQLVFKQFKEANPDWTSIQCFVIDKDFTEISVLKSEFRGVRILLCEWYVKKYLSSQIRDHANFGFTAFEKNELERVVDLLVAARLEEIYKRRLDYMYSVIVDHERQAKWKTYFGKMWNSPMYRPMWVAYERDNVPHLGNATNNRLEASWGKLKRSVHQGMPLDKSLLFILLHQRGIEKRWRDRLRAVGTTVVHGASPEFQKLANVVSPYAYELIEEQHRVADERVYGACAPHCCISSTTLQQPRSAPPSSAKVRVVNIHKVIQETRQRLRTTMKSTNFSQPGRGTFAWDFL